MELTLTLAVVAGHIIGAAACILFVRMTEAWAFGQVAR